MLIESERHCVIPLEQVIIVERLTQLLHRPGTGRSAGFPTGKGGAISGGVRHYYRLARLTEVEDRRETRRECAGCASNFSTSGSVITGKIVMPVICSN